MKKYCIIVLTLLFGANCLHAQADSTFWERITTLIGPSVDCFSATDDGIIALSGKTGVSAIYLSTDGAATWRATSVKGSVKAVYAASADNLLAVVDESIYHSSDTGKTWRSIPIGWKPILNRNDFKVSLRNVYSPAPNTLIAFVAITHNRDTNSFTTTIWYSKNLGVSWDSVASLSLSTHRIRYFKKNNILLVCGAKKHNISYSAYKGAIAASRDNGRTWKMMTDTLNEYTAVSDIIALSSSVLLAACSDNGLYRSEDAGKTWYRVPSLEKASVECIEINEHGTIFVGSNERIYTSTDTGKTWIGHPINNDTIGISMIQCTKRSVLLTTTAGIYRDTAFPSVFSREYDSIVVDNIRSVAFGRYGTIMAGFLGGSAVSDDTGKTWRNTSSHDVWQKATCITSKGTLLLYSSASREPRVKEHTLRSTDNGATWHEVYGIKSNGNTYPIYPDCFLAVGDTIFAGEGGILRSTDDGQTWRAMQGGSAMCLYRTRAGTYLAGDEGAISRSTDGGATFKPTDINTTLTSFIFFTDIVQNPKTGRLFAASTGFCNFGIYYSDDDGEIWIPHTQWLDRCTQKLAVDSIGNIYATSWY
ncbi:MAG: hypothetical protein LC116_04895, partial [Bacteroidetes bacterium]|nr:hypothetical protein [Bacteroidota bacterium]